MSIRPGASDGYLPALVACGKILLYTGIVPAFVYGGVLRALLVGFGLVALYFDGLYFNPSVPYLDTTVLAVDVTVYAACIGGHARSR